MAHLAKVFTFWRSRPAKALQIQAQTGKLMLHFAGRDSDYCRLGKMGMA